MYNTGNYSLRKSNKINLKLLFDRIVSQNRMEIGVDSYILAAYIVFINVICHKLSV